MEKFLVGKHISLHSLRPEDLKEDKPYFSWLDDLSLDLYTERGYFPNSEARMEAYYTSAMNNPHIILLGIFDNKTNVHIGNITFSEINWINRRASISYIIGNKNFMRKGLATDAVLMMMQYGFNKLNFERIWAGSSELNIGSIKVLKKSGFKKEGVMRNHLFRNGKHCNVIIFGSIRNEWIIKYGEAAANLFKVTIS